MFKLLLLNTFSMRCLAKMVQLLNLLFMIWTFSNVISLVPQNIPLVHAVVSRPAPPKIHAAMFIFLPAHYLLRKREKNSCGLIEQAVPTVDIFLIYGRKERKHFENPRSPNLFYFLLMGWIPLLAHLHLKIFYILVPTLPVGRSAHLSLPKKFN